MRCREVLRTRDTSLFVSSDESTLTAYQPKLVLARFRPQATLSWESSSLAITDGLLIGTSEQAGCVLKDRLVSRLHAELLIREDGVWIRDLRSRNGTFIEGVRVTEGRVPEQGAVLTLGGTKLRVSFGSAKPTPLWPLESFGELVGRSESMRALFNRLSALGPSQACALIQGETGTGKELIARAIHEGSARAPHPFIIVDCGALPEALLESELFGHARGAFTGADTARVGAIEAAAKGTVFLDEVGELPLSVQPRLLRALESKTIRRVGENAHVPVDVRFLAATHRDLQSMVAEGTFREDLYFRLAVLPVRVAPLRQRAEDVPPLLERFLGAPAFQKLGPRVLERALSYGWPGNVRELRSFAERIDALGIDVALELLGTQRLEAAPTRQAGGALEPVDPTVPFKVLRERWNDHLEREYLKGLITLKGRSSAELAEAAGLDRSYIHRLLRKHDL